MSTKENLALCRRYALAGFTNTLNGAWTYSDIPVGSRISFLYGARAYDMYVVKEKFCIRNAQSAPPWKPITFKSKLTYSFPFRFGLERIRDFEYPLTTDKFAYVAENLLLRGGYRKTHFQADSTDLGHASEIGELSTFHPETLEYSPTRFLVRFTRKQSLVAKPEVFPLWEIILQAAVRNCLSDGSKLSAFLELLGIEAVQPSRMEALGDKALPQGYVDVLLKEANPTGFSTKLLIEVKSKKASTEDFGQLASYVEEVGNECVGCALIAYGFPKIKVSTTGLRSIKYELHGLNDTFTFDELVSSLQFNLA